MATTTSPVILDSTGQDIVTQLSAIASALGVQIIITGNTDTTLAGVLQGSNGKVAVIPVDNTPTDNSTNLVSSGGVKTALDGKANPGQLAYVETGTTASRAYAVGEYFCWNGLLYRAKTAIGNGDTFTVNTNCEQVTVGNEIRDTGWILATAKISGTTTYYRKSGKIVSVTVDVNANVMTGSWQEITSLPSGFRPRITIYNNVYDYDGRTMFYAITEGGSVQIKGTSVNPLAFEAVFFAN